MRTQKFPGGIFMLLLTCSIVISAVTLCADIQLPMEASAYAFGSLLATFVIYLSVPVMILFLSYKQTLSIYGIQKPMYDVVRFFTYASITFTLCGVFFLHGFPWGIGAVFMLLSCLCFGVIAHALSKIKLARPA